LVAFLQLLPGFNFGREVWAELLWLAMGMSSLGSCWAD